MNKLIPLLAFSISFMILLGSAEVSEGGSVVLNPGDMIGSTIFLLPHCNCPSEGAVILISQTDGTQTFIGDPTPLNHDDPAPFGGPPRTHFLSGIAFDSSERLWGSTMRGQSSGSYGYLIEIDPTTGEAISQILITFNGVAFSIQDLAVQPESDLLYGISYVRGLRGAPPITLGTIDKTTGVWTPIGGPLATTSPPNSPEDDPPIPIGFAPDGTLYAHSFFLNSLLTLNPNDGTILSAVPTSGLTGFVDGLGVKQDGTIFVSDRNSGIYTINPVDGSTIFIGPNTPINVADLTFVPGEIESMTVVGGEIILIEQTNLILAGAQSFSWMIPVVLSGIGIGLIVFRKSENP